jgi:hypothetical protein
LCQWNMACKAGGVVSTFAGWELCLARIEVRHFVRGWQFVQEGVNTLPLNVQTTSLPGRKAPLKRQKSRSYEVKKFADARNPR